MFVRQALHGGISICALQLWFPQLNGALAMRYLVWVVRLIIFVVVLLFALKNTGPVDVRFFADYTATNVPLIVVMLIMLVLGSVLGWFIALPSILKYRREVVRIKREKSQLQERLDRAAAPLTEASVSAASAPIAPL